jgi:lipopolysaccharide export system permease protein
VGLLTTGVSGALNYALAPHAEQARKEYYEEMRGAEGREAELVGQIFRNRSENRTWFIQRFRAEKNEFLTVQVLQQDTNENIVTNYLAASASYRAEQHAWELRQVKVVNYDEGGNITKEQTLDGLVMTEWSETPFRLASSNMRADVLSFPELRDYLHFNSDFPHSLLAPFATQLHYRVALPWTCLIVVFLASPLAISFSRSGLLTNVAIAIGLVFSMQFLTHLFLALGEGDRIPAWVAAWLPNMFFSMVALLLLYVRSTNRELRELNPFAPRPVPAT